MVEAELAKLSLETLPWPPQRQVIIVARQAHRLEDAVDELAKEAEDVLSPTRFIARSSDVTNSREIRVLWEYLADQGIMFELRIEEVWSQFETNVKGPLLS